MRISQCYRRMARSVRVVQIGQPMRALLLVLLIWTPGAAPAQDASPYVPLQHWAMPYGEHLIAPGVLRDPTPLTRPLRQADLVRALEAVDTVHAGDAARASVQRLLHELRPRVPGPRYRLEGNVGLAAANYAVRDPLELGRGVPLRPYGPGRLFGSVGADLELTFGPGIAVTHPYEDTRSEERRVGKEGRSRWSPDH